MVSASNGTVCRVNAAKGDHTDTFINKGRQLVELLFFWRPAIDTYFSYNVYLPANKLMMMMTTSCRRTDSDSRQRRRHRRHSIVCSYPSCIVVL